MTLEFQVVAIANIYWAFTLPQALLSAMRVLSYSIFTLALGGGSYYLHFTDEKSEAPEVE